MSTPSGSATCERRDRSGDAALGYLRVSTADQATSGLGLAAQRAKVEAYATLHDLTLAEVIVDAGHSAKSLDRPGMTRLLDLIRRRRVAVVIVAKLDRITRSVRDLGELVDTFKRYGVEFASVADHIDTSTAAGRLVLNVMGSVSQWEREAIGERTAEALAAKRARCERVGGIPFGFTLADGTTGQLVEVAHEQRALGLIHRLRAAGLTYRAICSELHRQRIAPKSGARWHAKVVRALCQRQRLDR